MDDTPRIHTQGCNERLIHIIGFDVSINHSEHFLEYLKHNHNHYWDIFTGGKTYPTVVDQERIRNLHHQFVAECSTTAEERIVELENSLAAILVHLEVNNVDDLRPQEPEPTPEPAPRPTKRRSIGGFGIYD